IEVGNIFKLGTRYSEALDATYLDESGKERPIVMGSYGIGPARIIAAAIEQGADERGIVWPRSIAPWQLHLVSLAKGEGPVSEAADRIYQELLDAGAEVVYDDRDAGAGEKLTDCELLGCPLRLVVGKRTLAEGEIEAQVRRGGVDHRLSADAAASEALALLEGLR
ncbi:MAG: His/Gly/Thr/Pro-type tRNA ligase C-terminal domain-containing protein, partial [Solirubrobacterales bacterium]